MSTLEKTIFVRGQRPNFYKQVDLKLHRTHPNSSQYAANAYKPNANSTPSNFYIFFCLYFLHVMDNKLSKDKNFELCSDLVCKK